MEEERTEWSELSAEELMAKKEAIETDIQTQNMILEVVSFNDMTH